jgi:hypothetical protein
MQILDYSTVYPTKHNLSQGKIPEELLPFQEDVHGVSSIVHTVKELAKMAGTAKFALCGMATDGTTRRETKEIICFGVGEIEGKLCFRWCGEGNDPVGPGSHAVIPSYYDYRMDPAHVAAVIVANCRGHEIFRLT